MRILENRTALVTGGSSGIGLAAARKFASEGARVIITGRRAAAIDDAVRLIGDGAVGIEADSARLADHERLAHEISSRFGGRSRSSRTEALAAANSRLIPTST